MLRAVVSETGLLFGDKSPFDLKSAESLREGFKAPKVSEIHSMGSKTFYPIMSSQAAPGPQPGKAGPQF